MIPIARPFLGAEEAAAVLRVLASGQLAQGKMVAAFEQRFAEVCHVREAIAVSSGTAALHLALLAHGIGPGDEVITTAFSFAATANVILLVGATPVFVDIDPLTYTLDIAMVEAAITSHTRAVIPVHLYGHPCDMPKLMQLATTHHLAVIEDACQAHAASIDGRPVGSFGTGCFSFYSTKNMTTGEGGMVTTNDSAIAESIRLMRSHGQKERYYHIAMGHNLRMTEMQAALGVVQLEKLEQFTERRIANATYLSKHLSQVVQTPFTYPSYRHVYHQYTIRVPQKREEWIAQLQIHGVGTAIHYPTTIYRQPYYKDRPSAFHIAQSSTRAERDSRERKYLPVAEEAAEQVLSLPVHPGVTQEELALIVQEVLALCN